MKGRTPILADKVEPRPMKSQGRRENQPYSIPLLEKNEIYWEVHLEGGNHCRGGRGVKSKNLSTEKNLFGQKGKRTAGKGILL